MIRTDELVDHLFAPVRAILWIISIPLRITAWSIWRYREYSYDPEKLTCPACGFKGDSGTNGKSCSIDYARTQGGERAAIRHTCFRCGCNEIFTKLYLPGDKWLNSQLDPRLERIRRVTAEGKL